MAYRKLKLSQVFLIQGIELTDVSGFELLTAQYSQKILANVYLTSCANWFVTSKSKDVYVFKTSTETKQN